MNPSNQAAGPDITLKRTADYRDTYANSVQVRLTVWDFLLVFGTIEHQSPESVVLENFQGIYLSPQQAKALHNVLTHNLAQYEQTFGKIALEGGGPGSHHIVIPSGPVH